MAGTRSAILAALAALLSVDGAGDVLLGKSPAFLDQSQKLVTTDWVKKNGVAFSSNQETVTANTTLTAAALNSIVNLTGAGPYTVTLPLTSACPFGSTLTFVCSTSGAGANIVAQGSDNITGGNSINMQPGDTLTLASTGTGFWWTIGGSAELTSSAKFSSVLAQNGYQKLPTGLILQWGIGATPATGGLVVNLPLAFTVGGLGLMALPVLNAPTAVSFGGQFPNLSQLDMFSANSSGGAVACGFYWFAWGK